MNHQVHLPNSWSSNIAGIQTSTGAIEPLNCHAAAHYLPSFNYRPTMNLQLLNHEPSVCSIVGQPGAPLAVHNDQGPTVDLHPVTWGQALTGTQSSTGGRDVAQMRKSTIAASIPVGEAEKE